MIQQHLCSIDYDYDNACNATGFDLRGYWRIRTHHYYYSYFSASFPNAFSSTAAAAAQLQQAAANSPAGKQTEGCMTSVACVIVSINILRQRYLGSNPQPQKRPFNQTVISV